MADSYSFDVVSDFDRQELVNAVDQVRREVGQRYDLKDSATEIEVEDASLTITTASDMTLDAVVDVLRQKATKRNLSLKIFDLQTPEPVGGNRVKQVVKLRKGLSQELAKKLSKNGAGSGQEGDRGDPGGEPAGDRQEQGRSAAGDQPAARRRIWRCRCSSRTTADRALDQGRSSHPARLALQRAAPGKGDWLQGSWPIPHDFCQRRWVRNDHARDPGS